jgi:hypothetical protein
MSTLNVATVRGTTTSPPTFQNSNGTEIGTLCRAWVNFDGTGTVAIRAQFNVSSITDNGTGDYTVNFSNALTDANYSVIGLSGSVPTGGTNRLVSEAPNGLVTRTTSAIRIGVGIGGVATLIDDAYVNVVIHR